MNSLYLWVIPFLIIRIKSEESHSCFDRCERLFNRSLQRIGEDSAHIREAIQLHIKDDQAKSICWKFTDFDDCLRLCGKNMQEKRTKLIGERDPIRRKCKRITATSPYQKHFRCVHRYHNFMQIRCSSFAQEATKYRIMSKKAKNNHTKGVTRDVLIQETCRYLHYHSMCLANAVFGYCSDADELFNRFTMRDYFLSYVIPDQDQLFTDKLLDYCQLYDFQKMAKDLFEQTKSTSKRELNRDGSNVYVTHPMTMPFTHNAEGSTKRTTTLFDSEEDLQDVPPNFYYSSAKYPKHYTDARVNEMYRTTERGMTSDIDGINLITKPVNIDFSFESDLPEDSTGQYDINRNRNTNQNSNSPPRARNQLRQEDIPTQVTWPDIHPTVLTIDQVLDQGEAKKGVIPSVQSDWHPHYNLEGPKNSKRPGNRDYNRKQMKKIKGIYEDLEEDEDEYDEDGPMLPFSKVHIANIRSHDDIPSENDNFEVKPGADRGPLDNEDYVDYGSVRPVEATTLGDLLHSAITTALNPTARRPPYHTKEQTNTVLLLMVAYTIFFIAALIILISLIIAMLMRRKRQTYQTYIVKKPVKY
ncbi:unnamed protein product [Bursaphelenchus xylophilus]|uniref:(pine wood nematode) hypothetical protein n=1 Tax=Bursaphelenchus xylophilus TaxID=6326 RepID=A0A1I7SAD2_BURXY|nr:unnamed protein product [Bursaphelenchus xylophilus]CAG9084042.1 unnamed protein product [Bursaphelenchus xylophilus]